MVNKNQSLKEAFVNAFNGVKFVFNTQRNAKLHLFVTILVVLVGIFFNLSLSQWIDIVLVIGLVWAAECMNTAVEKLTDLASPEYHILARIAKDCAAAAVLMTSITAVIVGLLIFIPKLIILINTLR
jgi:diacylglycerol kinase